MAAHYLKFIFNTTRDSKYIFANNVRKAHTVHHSTISITI